MTCPTHPKLRPDQRCPCNPPEGTRGINTLYGVNAVLAEDGTVWLERIGDNIWFPTHRAARALDYWVPGGKPYRPVKQS